MNSFSGYGDFQKYIVDKVSSSIFVYDVCF